MRSRGSAAKATIFEPPFVYGLLIVAALLLGIGIDLATYRSRHRDVIFPGVRAGGIELGGLSETEAVERLSEDAGMEDGALVLRDPVDAREWRFAPTELGLRSAPSSAAGAAYDVGRSGRPLADLVATQRARWFGVTVRADRGFDEDSARLTLEALAPEVDVAPSDARIEEAEDGVREVLAESGRQLDIEGTLAALREQAGRLDRAVVDIAILNTAPRVFDLSDVEAAYNLATSGPITLTWRRRSFQADAEQVAAWFRLEDLPNDEGRIVPSIVVDRDAIREWLESIAPQVRTDQAAARFDIEFGTVSLISPATVGGILDVEASIERAIEAAYTDGRVAELAVQELAPSARSDTQTLLQGVLPIAQAYVGFEGAPPAVIANLAAAARTLDGIALAPGQTFSLLAELGDPLDLEGIEPTILGLPADGIGHAATAAYRAALLAGLPIVERHAPQARVGWYEPPIGLDAAVLYGARDLRFTNDTGDWMLFDVVVDQGRIALAWTIHAKAAPRPVRLIGPTVTLITPPPEGPAEVREIAGLPAGATVQAGWAREGARVVLERVVTTREGERRELIESDYPPAGDLFLIGPIP